MSRRVLSALLLTVALAATACGGDSDPADGAGPSPPVTSGPPAAEPVGLLAIGHSGMTGVNSEPSADGGGQPQNSWVTGTNPDVNSICRRMVKVLPETKGNCQLSAQNGAGAGELTTQAGLGLDFVPTPALVVIQTFDNDIGCDGSDKANAPVVAQSIKDALDAIVQRSPGTKILLLSIAGDMESVATAVASHPQLKEEARGNGPCDFVQPDGEVSRAAIKNATRINAGYHESAEEACAEVPQCTWDDGRASNYQERAGYLASDGHANVDGHRAFAAWMWPTVATVLGVKA